MEWIRGMYVVWGVVGFALGWAAAMIVVAVVLDGSRRRELEEHGRRAIEARGPWRPW